MLILMTLTVLLPHTFPLPPLSLQQQPPPVTTVSLLRPHANLSSLPSLLPRLRLLLFLFTVSSSPGTVATHPAEDSKLARTRFPPAAAPALGPTTGAQPLSEGGGEVPRSAMVTRVQHGAAQCAVQSTVHLQCRTERRQPASLLVQVRLSSFASHFIPVLRLQRLTKLYHLKTSYFQMRGLSAVAAMSLV